MSEKDIFDDLVPLRSRLNDASVKANRALKAAKQRLKELSLDVEAWIPLESEVDRLRERSAETLFGYAYRTLGDNPEFPETQKEKGARWDLWIRYEEESPHEGYYYAEPPRPVLSCRRHVRIAAAGALERLRDKIKENAQRAIDEVDQTASQL